VTNRALASIGKELAEATFALALWTRSESHWLISPQQMYYGLQIPLAWVRSQSFSFLRESSLGYTFREN
jgi:hypothetical protein